MKKLYIIILILVCIVTFYFFYNKVAFLNVIVSFDELEPFDKKLPVYYKGYKIGKSGKIFPDKDYVKTYVKLKITPSDIKLPSNVTARIEKTDSKDFINIIYPNDVSLKKLSEGDVIKGTISKDLNDILVAGGVDNLISDTATLLESANTTVGTLNEIFTQINDIVKDSRKDIKLATANLAKTTTNLEKMTANLNSSLDKKTMEKSVKNIESATKSISEITTQIDKTTIPMVNGVICQTNSTMENVNEITGGVKATLKKHWGLGRLMFGRPISKDCK